MSPSKGVIYGPRSSSSSLTIINKDSHAIGKPVVPNPSAKRQPVIIYTHSPKTICCHMKQFKFLVQSLTGLDQSEEDELTVKIEEAETTTKDDEENDNHVKDVVVEENVSPSSVLADDDKLLQQDFNCADHLSPMYNPYMGDFPLFAPNSTDFFFSNSTSNSMFQSASMANPFSHSYMDY